MENLANYLTKGKQVYVEGRLRNYSYDAKDGTKKYASEVVADTVMLLGGRESGSRFPEPTDEDAEKWAPPRATSTTTAPDATKSNGKRPDEWENTGEARTQSSGRAPASVGGRGDSVSGDPPQGGAPQEWEGQGITDDDVPF